MGRFHFLGKANRTWICVLTLLPLAFGASSAQAITASIGKPYQGRLINGIPFPRQFRGYHLREADKTYTTPEVISALLDAVEAIRKQFPGTCDLYLGDFSKPGGGWLNHHRSHQNGRDVDIGMFAQNNRFMDRFKPMNRQNLDVPKTWQLIEDILGSQRVQYIFLDKRIQALLHRYALSRGSDPVYLDRLFGNVKGAVIQHIPGHRDHMHVRFFAPWSTMAGRLRGGDLQQRTIVELAQQAYLPKQVRYYVNTTTSLTTLAQSFGVNRMDLCRWNHLRANRALSPGTCLVYYKRGFEVEPVHLAQSLQPRLALEPPPLRLASLKPETITLRDLPAASQAKHPQATKARVQPTTYKVKRGDTLWSIAKHHGTDVATLRKINRLRKGGSLRAGQTLRLTSGKTAAGGSDRSNRGKTYTIRRGDSLWAVARKYGTSPKRICQVNGLSLEAALHPGMKISLP